MKYECVFFYLYLHKKCADYFIFQQNGSLWNKISAQYLLNLRCK